MTTSVVTDPTTAPPITQISSEETEPVTCHCCGLTEECTQTYIEKIKECYMGKWICGLCSEAVKYEVVRTKRLLSKEEAMTKHMNMCYKFKSTSPPLNPTTHLISAMRQILRRSLLRSMPNSPSKDDHDDCVSNVLSRSDSCFC
ncbi:unnamed protein product [Cochlearia groenlandica]